MLCWKPSFVAQAQRPLRNRDVGLTHTALRGAAVLLLRNRFFSSAGNNALLSANGIAKLRHGDW